MAKQPSDAFLSLVAFRDEVEERLAKQQPTRISPNRTTRPKSDNPVKKGKAHHVGPCVEIGPNGTRVLKADVVVHMVVPARKGGTRAYQDARAQGRTIRSSGRKPLNPANWLLPPVRG